jgi:hypothetical protein
MVLLYEFQTAKGASDYCKAELDHTTTTTPDIVRLPFAAVPDAALLAFSDGTTNTAFVSGATGVWCAYIGVNEPVTADSTAQGQLVATLALAQFDKLKNAHGNAQ